MDANQLAKQYRLPPPTVQEIINDERRAALLRSPLAWLLFALGMAACIGTWVFRAVWMPMIGSGIFVTWVMVGHRTARQRILAALEDKQRRVWGAAACPAKGDAR